MEDVDRTLQDDIPRLRLLSLLKHYSYDWITCQNATVNFKVYNLNMPHSQVSVGSLGMRLQLYQLSTTKTDHM